MRRTGALAATYILAAGAALAQPGVPGPDYFRGLYERVGRGFDDRVAISPDGIGLRLHACAGADIVLAFDPYGARQNAMVGGPGDGDLGCLFHIDGHNRPILTCRSDGGARFTLWPVEPGFRSAPLDCG